MPTILKSGSLNLLEPSGPVQGLLYCFLHTSLFLFLDGAHTVTILKQQGNLKKTSTKINPNCDITTQSVQLSCHCIKKNSLSLTASKYWRIICTDCSTAFQFLVSNLQHPMREKGLMGDQTINCTDLPLHNQLPEIPLSRITLSCDKPCHSKKYCHLWKQSCHCT